MPLTEAVTIGMRINDEVTPWYVYDVAGAGRFYWDKLGTETLDEVIAASEGQCNVYVSPNTFRQLVQTRPDLIVKSQLDTKFTIITENPWQIKYLPEPDREKVLQAIDQGGFAAINADLRVKAQWDAAPNPERGGH